MTIKPLLAAFSIFWAGVSIAQSPIAIVIHGGAGTLLPEHITAEQRAEYHKALSTALKRGFDLLSAGKTSEDAIIAAITSMEDSPLFNAGHGAVLTHQGTAELDASIMLGADRNAGAVAGVSTIKNPILAAREVMHHSPHVMLAGHGADDFAEQRGLTIVDNAYFITPRRQQQLERLKHEEQRTLDDKAGPVGAVALDQFGNIAAGTSTGGMSNKRFGRIGDAPIIGAGTYADNRTCGISATGHGEYFIRAGVAYNICQLSRLTGISLQQAADEVVKHELVDMGGEGGIIGLDPQGNIVISFNSTGMYRGWIDSSGQLSTAIFKEN